MCLMDPSIDLDRNQFGSNYRRFFKRPLLASMALQSPGKRAAEQNDNDTSTQKRRRRDIGARVAPPKIRVFTDFSGIEAPILALEGLRVDYLHVGACEKSPSLQKFIRKNFMPQVLYKDPGVETHDICIHVDLTCWCVMVCSRTKCHCAKPRCGSRHTLDPMG